MSNRTDTPLALSMGEPAGIGPDLILALYAERRVLKLPPFIVYGNADLLDNRAKRLGLDIPITPATPHAATGLFTGALPVVDIGEPIADTPGTIGDAASATTVTEAIALAADDVLAEKCRALVTAPIHKAALYKADFTYPGHTEYLAALCASGAPAPQPVMMLAHEKYRAVPLTVHVPLKDVPNLVTENLIINTTRIVAHDLGTRFGIAQPRIAIAGLNPHAGEDGSIGIEDRDVIVPAIAALKAEGINADGPHPGDTIFHPPHWAQYDAVIAMYHDQALIPIKTLAFDKGVNITLGLPIVRTSPDHGTAFGLAGTGKASANSMLAAIRMADEMSG